MRLTTTTNPLRSECRLADYDDTEGIRYTAGGWRKIVVCPFDHAACKEEMEAIEQAAKDAAHVSADNPLLPPVKVIRANDPEGLRALGIGIVGGVRKPYIEGTGKQHAEKDATHEASCTKFVHTRNGA